MTDRDTSEFRKPHHGDLEIVVNHFLTHLSNEPGKDGISPRKRFYGTLPVQAKLLFPDVPDDVFTSAVTEVIAATQRQVDILPKGRSSRHREDDTMSTEMHSSAWLRQKALDELPRGVRAELRALVDMIDELRRDHEDRIDDLEREIDSLRREVGYQADEAMRQHTSDYDHDVVASHMHDAEGDVL